MISPKKDLRRRRRRITMKKTSRTRLVDSTPIIMSSTFENKIKIHHIMCCVGVSNSCCLERFLAVHCSISQVIDANLVKYGVPVRASLVNRDASVCPLKAEWTW